MPYRKRPRIEPTEDWAQLQLHLAWPEQVSYELIRPVVLFGASRPSGPSRPVLLERTIYRKADRFDTQGMARAVRDHPGCAPPRLARGTSARHCRA